MSEGWIRVYFEDDAWTTVGLQENTTAEEVCSNIARKRNMDPTDAKEQLFLVFDNNDNQVQKHLASDSFPLQLQSKMRQHHYNYKFIYKKVEENQEESDDEMYYSDEDNGFISKCNLQKMDGYQKAGYLEKRGKVNKAWRERWFVLQGDKLCYFKSNNHTNALAEICVTDAAIRESPRPHARCRDFLFEVSTKQRVYCLKAQSYQIMCDWITQLKRVTQLDDENFVIDQIQSMIHQIELKKSNMKCKVVKEISTLEGTLKNPTALDKFMKFVQAEHSEENLLFWRDAENYRLTDRDPASLKKKGTAIFKKFIDTRATYQVGSSKKEREKIKAMIEQGNSNRDAFLQVQDKCLTHMKEESFPKFVKSEHYKKALLDMPIAHIMDVDITLDGEHKMESKNDNRKKSSLFSEKKQSLKMKRPISPKRSKKGHNKSRFQKKTFEAESDGNENI